MGAVLRSSSPCAVNSIRLQISVVFALNAESACFPSQLLCLLSSFLLNIVSVGVVATDFFIVMTFLGLLLVREGGLEGGRGGQVSVCPRIAARTWRWPQGVGSPG